MGQSSSARSKKASNPYLILKLNYIRCNNQFKIFKYFSKSNINTRKIKNKQCKQRRIVAFRESSAAHFSTQGNPPPHLSLPIIEMLGTLFHSMKFFDIWESTSPFLTPHHRNVRNPVSLYKIVLHMRIHLPISHSPS